MIYLDEKIMDLGSSVFAKDNFIKENENYYFIAENIDENIYLAIKLIPDNNSSNKFELKTTKIFTEFIKNMRNEKIIKEELVKKVEDKDFIIESFFHYLSYETDSKKIKIYENILLFLKDYIKRHFDSFFSYNNYYEDSKYKKGLYVEFLDLFLLKGEAVEGFYNGNLVLCNIELKNNITNEVIKNNFKNINLTSNFYVEENDEVKYMIEGFLESMSEVNIQEKFKKLFF